MLSGKLTNECVPIILSPAPISYIISTAAESKAIIFSGDFLNIIFLSLEPVIINGYDVGAIASVCLEFVIFFVMIPMMDYIFFLILFIILVKSHHH